MNETEPQTDKEPIVEELKNQTKPYHRKELDDPRLVEKKPKDID